MYNPRGGVRRTRNLTIMMVSAGPKGIKKYKRLMLHRIKWMDDLGEAEEESEGETEEQSKFGRVSRSREPLFRPFAPPEHSCYYC